MSATRSVPRAAAERADRERRRRPAVRVRRPSPYSHAQRPGDAIEGEPFPGRADLPVRRSARRVGEHVRLGDAARVARSADRSAPASPAARPARARRRRRRGPIERLKNSFVQTVNLSITRESKRIATSRVAAEPRVDPVAVRHRGAAVQRAGGGVLDAAVRVRLDRPERGRVEREHERRQRRSRSGRGSAGAARDQDRAADDDRLHLVERRDRVLQRPRAAAARACPTSRCR